MVCRIVQGGWTCLFILELIHLLPMSGSTSKYPNNNHGVGKEKKNIGTMKVLVKDSFSVKFGAPWGRESRQSVKGLTCIWENGHV